VTFSQLESSGKSAPKELTGISPTEDDIALIQYTSGMKIEKNCHNFKYRKYILPKNKAKKNSNCSVIRKILEYNSGTKNLKKFSYFSLRNNKIFINEK
jgi:hypothetical protein